MDAEEIKRVITAPRSVEPVFKKEDLLSTGSTVLNLACTGYKEGGFIKGRYYFWVGDSSSGKTFFARTCLAEATINKHFSNHRLIYDDVEGGALMDTVKFFGQGLADRLEAPRYDNDHSPINSDLIEDFYYHIDDAIEDGRPFIYVLDSMDALGSTSEQDKFSENKSRSRKDKDPVGSYGDGKAKINASGLRNLMAGLRDTGSILLIINQTRDNIGAGMFEPKKTRSGGHALTFYSTLEIWSHVGSAIKRTYNKKDRIIGRDLSIRIKKNRASGRERTVSVPIYYSVGIDDLGGCIKFLVSEGRWSKNKGGVISCGSDFMYSEKEEKLVEIIEENNLIEDIRDIVQEVWNEIEAACAVRRVNRYQKEVEDASS